MDALEVILPSGFLVGGTWHREAQLRPLASRDEAFLQEDGQTLLPTQRSTTLLARCLTRLGPLPEPVTSEAVRSLRVGDREALLLHLRRLTLGNRMQCILSCADPACGEKMDLDLNVSDLLVPAYPQVQERYETLVKDNGIAYRVCFRLPTGADQEEVASLACTDPQVAAELLLRRCVEQVTTEGGDVVSSEDWLPAVVQQLPAVMAELDPQAEVLLHLTCPLCGHVFSALFDAGAYFFQELAGRARLLYREVHLLALHYHWSEAEIMGMTASKRRLYLDLLAESLTEEGRG
jgi:hypothetical protein